MTNTQPPQNLPPTNNRPRPLRRPGWRLIQDVRPDVRPRQGLMHSVALRPSESNHHPATSLSKRPPATAVRTTSRSRRLTHWLRRYSLVLIAPIIIIASIRLSTLPLMGEGLIIAYGLIVVVRRLPSRLSFLLATIVLISIAVEFLLLQGHGNVNNSALFVFMLLAVGLLSSMLEMRRLSSHNKVRRRR